MVRAAARVYRLRTHALREGIGTGGISRQPAGSCPHFQRLAEYTDAPYLPSMDAERGNAKGPASSAGPLPPPLGSTPPIFLYSPPTALPHRPSRDIVGTLPS